MNKIFYLIVLFVLIPFVAFSQTNSVTLKDGGGIVISQHSSIQAAYDAIPATITQAYKIEINAIYDGSNETFPITFTLRTGASSANTITLMPAAGNTGEVITGSSSTGILILNDADFVNIDGRPGGTGTAVDLKIVNLATTGTNANTIQLLNGATNNVIKYVYTINSTQNTAGPRNIVLGTTTTVGNSNNTITKCKIEGGRSGIGSAGSATIPNDSITISNCEIYDWGYAGIWFVSGTQNANIDSCKIYQTTGINNTLVSGMILSTVGTSTYNIRKNWIYDLQTTSVSASSLRGIYFATPSAGCIINIENNIISNKLDNILTSTITGIELLGSNVYTANLYYNTVYIGGNHTGGTSGSVTSAGIRIGASALILNMKNNIAINKRTGGAVTHAGFALTNTGGTLNIDYNCYYANGTNSFNAFWGATGYNTIADYKTAVSPNEQNTVFQDVNFVSLTDLHLTGISIGDINLRGTPIAGIIRDFDDELRNPVAPYKGADEGSTPLFIQDMTTVKTYSLSQNYPNPFNPVTKINFSLPKAGFVTLKIYDILGKEIKTLINDIKQQGNYAIDFNASNLTSGIYFYKLESGNFSDVKSMVLIK